MNNEEMFNKLIGKFDLLLYINISSIGKPDEDHPYDTKPEYMATYIEIIGLVGQAEYDEGIGYYHHKSAAC